MADQILVIDVGTSSTKAVLFDMQGRVRAEREAAYQTRHFHDGYHEQDPHDWWRTTVDAVSGLGDLSKVSVVALAGTMQSVIPLDRDGNPLRPAILYSDSRAARQFDHISPEFIALRAGELIGNQPNEFMSVFKMAWMRSAEPEAFKRTARFHSGAKDFVISKLTGLHVTDPTAATTVGLMDIKTHEWLASLAGAAGVPLDKLPRIARSDEHVGVVRNEAARCLGVRSGTPVINGIGDAGASTLGAGVRAAGDTYMYLGTTAWVAQVSKLADLQLPQQVYTLAHPDRGLAIRVGATLAGGDCAAWCRELCGAPFNELEAQLTAIDRAPPSLIFLPYLKGERSPFQDPAVRGAFLGLERSHQLAHLFYAVLEGVAYALRENLRLLGPVPEELPVIGGGASSRLWPQIIADVCGTTVLQTETPTTATAYGAFTIAAQMRGIDPSTSQWTRPLQPRPERMIRCEQRGKRFAEATTFARQWAARSTAGVES